MSDEPKPISTKAFGREVGHKLLGTCKGIYEIEGAEELELDAGFCEGLDEVAMTCTTCGWWMEPCELDDDQVCKECGGDPDPD